MKVTPEYLLSRGFVKYHDPDDTGIYQIPFYNPDDLHFMEKVFDRNMFVVILQPDVDDYSVYVQEDAGCGFVRIPLRFSELDSDCLESLYNGIRGQRLI
jgi:hypothetical protein